MPDNDRPATKRDVEQSVERAVHELRDELRETIHDTETRLLKAFYNFAETNGNRVMELEQRLNMPPSS